MFEFGVSKKTNNQKNQEPKEFKATIIEESQHVF